MSEVTSFVVSGSDAACNVRRDDAHARAAETAALVYPGIDVVTVMPAADQNPSERTSKRPLFSGPHPNRFKDHAEGYVGLCLVVLEQWPHEGPLIPQHTTTFVSNAISCDEILIDSETTSELLIIRKAWKAEERQGTVARAF